MEAATQVAAQLPVSVQVVGNAFVQQYYHILHNSPGVVHRFYHDISKLGRPEEDGSMSITTTLKAIDEKIVSLNYGDFRAEIKTVDAQESFDGGVHVLVTGYLTGKDNAVHNFAQSFFLAPQEMGYFVLNDMFRYVDSVSVNSALATDVVVPPVTEEPVVAPTEENHFTEQVTPAAEEATTGEVCNPPENGDAPVVEEVPVAEVVDEVQDDTHMIVGSSAKIEEVPKKSYASIVMRLKESGATLSPSLPAPRKVTPKNIEPVIPTFSPVTVGPVSSSEAVDNENNQDGEAEGYSIYIKGLPMNATDSLLDEVFKKFGTIKNDGIQVRSKQQGFCFGFVEFEEASSVQKALEASPVSIGGRQAFVEEKRSTNSRGNNRGRFQSGRGSGFRSEGARGRGGNYGGGGGSRGYNNRGDFNGRNEFGNRGGNSRNHDGYQRSENSNNNSNNGGGRMNRAGGGNGIAISGATKNTTPGVSATA
ncbi:hypothetical protein OROGR_022230 [Orobanche gracilis]